MSCATYHPRPNQILAKVQLRFHDSSGAGLTRASIEEIGFLQHDVLPRNSGHRISRCSVPQFWQTRPAVSNPAMTNQEVIASYIWNNLLAIARSSVRCSI
jgi:hypothetical protein